MNDIFWLMVVLMILNIAMFKVKIPIIAIVLGLATLMLGVASFAIPDIPLNPLFSLMILMVSGVSTFMAIVEVKKV